jgi:hypothetical protein
MIRSLSLLAWPSKQLGGASLRHSSTAGRGDLHKRLYEVVRQDDNANTFVIAAGLELMEAQKVSSMSSASC